MEFHVNQNHSSLTGEPTDVKIRIKTPKNFPIDLYYLMDLSKSMTDDKANVAKLGDILCKYNNDYSHSEMLGDFGLFGGQFGRASWARNLAAWVAALGYEFIKSQRDSA